jgi:hypothetical protein
MPAIDPLPVFIDALSSVQAGYNKHGARRQHMTRQNAHGLDFRGVKPMSKR